MQVTLGTGSNAFTTAGGTAVSGSDYQSTTQSVYFGVGDATATFRIRMYGDNDVEDDETITFVVTGLSGATVGTAQVVIADDDGALVASAAASSMGGTEISTSSEATSTLDAAIHILAAAGYDVSSLEGVTIQIADLPGTQLARVVDDAIVVDVDAAGWGWFIDPTPDDDTEFEATARGRHGRTASSPANGAMDLLTVIMHELGHLLGLDHDATGFMVGELTAGTRIRPTGRER